MARQSGVKYRFIARVGKLCRIISSSLNLEALRRARLRKLSERLQQVDMRVHRLVADKAGDWNTFTSFVVRLTLNQPHASAIQNNHGSDLCERVHQSNEGLLRQQQSTHLASLICGCCVSRN
jgi:hypothetical protein